jgi:hypothetical protein
LLIVRESSSAKRLGSCVIEANDQALIEFLKIQTGNLHMCLEEGTQAGWLVEILSPHVAELVVMVADYVSLHFMGANEYARAKG